MTEQIAALSLDFALDGERGIDLNGSESLLSTARSVQGLFDGQHEVPSEEFVMQLERSLFTPAVIPSEAEGPPAAAVSRPQPSPRPAPFTPKRTGIFRRWAAIAAALILLLGGAGAIVLGPFDPRSTPEPSAIPAASFASPASSDDAAVSSPASSMSGIDWIAPPPDDTSPLMTLPDYAHADGRIFRVFPMRVGWSHIQAVDTDDGAVLWDLPLSVGIDVIGTYDQLLLVASHSGATPETGALLALDAQTGQELWRTSLSGYPVDMKIVGSRAFVLARDNDLDAIDLDTHQSIYTADIGGRSQPYTSNQQYTTSGRLAVIDGTLAAVLADGSIAGIELDSGNGQWWNKKSEPGPSEVHAVNGTFIMVDSGSWEDVRSESGYPTPAPVGTAGPPSCQDAMQIFTGEQIPDSDRNTEVSVVVFGLDPGTGEPRWVGEKTRDKTSFFYSDTGVVFGVANDEKNGPEDVSICSVNAATGEVSRIEQLADLSDWTFRMKFFNDTDVELAVTIFEDGRFLAFPPGLYSQVIEPAIDLRSDPWLGGIAWVDVLDGQIYLSLSDGRLIKVHSDQPASPSTDSVETPQPATPVASDTGWVVPGPEGDDAELQASSPLVDNGRIFRSFFTITVANHTQAVDMSTGDVLWDVPLDVRGEVMAPHGNLLLVGGRVGGLLKDSSLVALDQATGEEVWHVTLSDFPVAIAVDGDRAFVLGANNQLDAIDLTSGASIYATDIGGDLEPHASFPTLGSGNRLAIDGNRLVAVLADGTVAGVDIESGAGIWWNLLGWSHSVRVGYLDGALVVAEYGATDEPNGTPVAATPASSATPVPATCLDSFSSASPVADSDRDESPMIGVTYLRIDPETGGILWSVESSEFVPGQFVNNVGVVYLANTAEDWPTDPSQVALCSIDPSDGQSFEVDRLSNIGGSRFLMTMNIDGVQREVIMIDLGGGRSFVAPTMLDPTVSGPTITIDLGGDGPNGWMGIYDDAIYLSQLDGSLEKIPIPAQ